MSVHVYLQPYQSFHQTYYLQDIHDTRSLGLYKNRIIFIIFDTAPRPTGSSSFLVYSKQHRISVNTDWRGDNKTSHTHTHTHTHRGKRKDQWFGTGEGVTNRQASEPFGTLCHHVVTKRVGSTSNLTRFVTLTHLEMRRLTSVRINKLKVHLFKLNMALQENTEIARKVMSGLPVPVISPPRKIEFE